MSASVPPSVSHCSPTRRVLRPGRRGAHLDAARPAAGPAVAAHWDSAPSGPGAALSSTSRICEAGSVSRTAARGWEGSVEQLTFVTQQVRTVSLALDGMHDPRRPSATLGLHRRPPGAGGLRARRELFSIFPCTPPPPPVPRPLGSGQRLGPLSLPTTSLPRTGSCFVVSVTPVTPSPRSQEAP